MPRSSGGASEVRSTAAAVTHQRQGCGRCAGGDDEGSVEPAAYLGRPARIVVVDDLHRSQTEQTLCSGSRRGRGYLDALGRGELDGQGSGAPASVGDQEPLSSAEVQLLQSLQRGEPVDRQCRCVCRVQAWWAGRRVIRVDQNAFAPEAASSGQRGFVREHPVAHGKLGDTRTDGQHLACALHSQRRRGRSPTSQRASISSSSHGPTPAASTATRIWPGSGDDGSGSSSRATSVSALDTPHAFIVDLCPLTRSGRPGGTGREPKSGSGAE